MLAASCAHRYRRLQAKSLDEGTHPSTCSGMTSSTTDFPSASENSFATSPDEDRSCPRRSERHDGPEAPAAAAPPPGRDPAERPLGCADPPQTWSADYRSSRRRE